MIVHTRPLLGLGCLALVLGCSEPSTSNGETGSSPDGSSMVGDSGGGDSGSENAEVTEPEQPEQTGMPSPLQEMQAFIDSKDIDFEAGTSRLNLPEPPLLEFAGDETYFWNLETNLGDIKVRLMPDVAPMHVSSTMYLTLSGFYDGLGFHRIIPGFMAQGGCPLGTGTGSPGYGYDGEFDKNVRHSRPGLLSMANTGRPKSDGSQFFLTFVPYPSLDDKHSIFGEVVEGMDTMREMEKRGTRSGATTERVTLKKATITVE